MFSILQVAANYAGFLCATDAITALRIVRYFPGYAEFYTNDLQASITDNYSGPHGTVAMWEPEAPSLAR